MHTLRLHRIRQEAAAMTDPREQEPPDRGNEDDEQDDDWETLLADEQFEHYMAADRPEDHDDSAA
jgi:hypothetical protein